MIVKRSGRELLRTGIHTHLDAMYPGSLEFGTDGSSTPRSGNSFVTRWKDISGNTNHFVSTAGGVLTTEGLDTSKNSNRQWISMGNVSGDHFVDETLSKSLYKFLHDGTGGTIAVVYKYASVDTNKFEAIAGTGGGSKRNNGFVIARDTRSSNNTMWFNVENAGLSGKPVSKIYKHVNVEPNNHGVIVFTHGSTRSDGEVGCFNNSIHRNLTQSSYNAHRLDADYTNVLTIGNGGEGRAYSAVISIGEVIIWNRHLSNREATMTAHILKNKWSVN